MAGNLMLQRISLIKLQWPIRKGGISLFLKITWSSASIAQYVLGLTEALA